MPTYAALREADLLHVEVPDVAVGLLVDLPGLPEHPGALHVGAPVLVKEGQHCLQHQAVGRHDLLLQPEGELRGALMSKKIMFKGCVFWLLRRALLV